MKKILRFLGWTCFFGIIFSLCACLLVVLSGYIMYRQATDPRPLERAVAEIRANETYCKLEDIAPVYLDALLAIEDPTFYDHTGFNLQTTWHAMLTNIRSGERLEGGSTISQQLAKNIYFTEEKLFTRKVAELFVVYDMETSYTKQEILELYINLIYYGNYCYGITQAAEGYFQVSPAELTLDQAAFLAGMLKAPTTYANNPERAERRKQDVLAAMIAEGYLTESEWKGSTP